MEPWVILTLGCMFSVAIVIGMFAMGVAAVMSKGIEGSGDTFWEAYNQGYFRDGEDPWK